MKKMTILLLLIMTFPLHESIAETCNDTCDTDWSIWSEAEVEMPGYEGCSVTFTYRYRECIISGQKWSQFDIVKFKVYTNGGDSCKRLFDSLTLNGQNIGLLTWMFNQGFVELSIYKFLQGYNLALKEDKWEFECPQIKTRFESVIKSCAQFVCYFEPDGLGPNTGNYRFEIDPCNDFICCIRILDICWDTVENRPKVTELIYHESGECSTFPEEHPGCVWETDCVPLCVEPE